MGGAGHTTELLRHKVRQLYPTIAVDGLPEAVIFNQYLQTQYGLHADLLETESTNCGNNITYLLDLLRRHHIKWESMILTQDATMQLRMSAVLKKYLHPDQKIINYAAYHALVTGDASHLTFTSTIHGMWNMDHYLELLMGEIPRLTDNAEGYGPKGKDYLIHVDIPPKVEQAFSNLQQLSNVRVRPANVKFASKS